MQQPAPEPEEIVNKHLRLSRVSSNRIEKAAKRVGVPSTALTDAWFHLRAGKVHLDTQVVKRARAIATDRASRGGRAKGKNNADDKAGP